MTQTRSKVKSAFALLTALIVALFIFAIPGAEVSAATLKLNKTSITLAKGTTTTLKVSGASYTPKWSSSKSSVASVSSTGKVTARAAGTCYIYATVGSSRLKCKVKVINPSVSASSRNLSLGVGESQVVTITAKGSHSLKVASSNKSVASTKWASTSFSGDTVKLRINALNPGTATIKVYMKNKTSVYTTIKVNVAGGSQNQPVQDLSASTTTVSVNAGASQTVTITSPNAAYLQFTPSNANIANYSVGSVNNGKVPVSINGISQGTAYLTVTDPYSGKSVRITINVGSGLVLSPSALNISVGSTGTVTVTGSGYYIDAQTSNASIATVSITNQQTNRAVLTVEGRGQGTTTITVTDRSNGANAKLNVNVTGSTFSVTPASLSMNVGDTKTVTISCSNVNNLSITNSNGTFVSLSPTYTSTTRCNLNVQANEAGQGYIYIRDAVTNETKTVTVTVSGGSFMVTPSILNMKIGETKTITVSCANVNFINVNDPNGFITTSETDTTSTKKTITVKALSNGNGYIYIYDGSTGQTKTVSITVSGGEFSVSPTNLVFTVGDNAKSITVNCSDAYQISCQDNNNFIVTNTIPVSATRATITVTPISAGSGTIVIYDGSTGRSQYVSITVQGATGLNTLTVSKNYVEITPLMRSQSVQITASDANYIQVESSNYGVATVSFSAQSITSGYALISGVGPGSCVITVTDTLTRQQRTITVTVTS